MASVEEILAVAVDMDSLGLARATPGSASAAHEPRRASRSKQPSGSSQATGTHRLTQQLGTAARRPGRPPAPAPAVGSATAARDTAGVLSCRPGLEPQPEAQSDEQPRSKQEVALEMAQKLASNRFAASAPNIKLKQTLDLLQQAIPGSAPYDPRTDSASDDPRTLISISLGPRSDIQLNVAKQEPEPEQEHGAEPNPQAVHTTVSAAPLIRIAAAGDSQQGIDAKPEYPTGKIDGATASAATARKRDASRQKAAARRARQRERKVERHREEEEAQDKQGSGDRQQTELNGTPAPELAVAQTGGTELSTVRPQSASFAAQPTSACAGQINKNRSKRQRNKLKAANRAAKAAAEPIPGAGSNEVKERPTEQPDAQILKRQGKV